MERREGGGEVGVGMARPLGGLEFGGGLLLADGFCLGNGGPGVHLLNHAIARVGHHPGWGCFSCLGEIGIHRLAAVVINQIIFHVLGMGGPWEGYAENAAAGCQQGPGSPLKADPQKLLNHGGCPKWSNSDWF